MSNVNRYSRRDALKGAATLGVISVAGVGSVEGGEEYTITIGATSTGSATQAAAQAYARAANEVSDILTIDPQETGGWTANLYEFDGGNIPAMGVDNNSLSKAMNEEGPFEDEPVEELPMQGFVFTELDIYWMALEGSDVEHVEDIREGGLTIYPIQPGFGTRLLTEEILQSDGMWEGNDILNVDTSDIPGAVEEGRVDALCIYGANGVELASWVQEVDVRSGGSLYVVETDDQFAEAIQDHPGAVHTRLEPYGWEQEVDTVYEGEVDSWTLAGQWAYGPQVPAEATHEMARLALEHDDVIREADPTTLDHDPESMTNAVLPDLEVHPGIADFFEENDVWDDEWTRGEAD